MIIKYCPECSGNMNERMIDRKPRYICSNCGFIFYQGPKLAVATIVAIDHKILLNKRDIEPRRGLWSFPSGYVDLGESVEAAAIRETQEETGLTINLDGLVGVYSQPDRPVVLVVYAGTMIGGELTFENHEVQDVGFFDLNDLPPLAFEHDQDIIRDWLSKKDTFTTSR